MKSIGTVLSWEIIDKLLSLPARDWKTLGLQQDKANVADRAARIKERTDARQMNTTPSMSMEEISGLYRHDMYGEIKIVNEGGKVFIDFTSSPGLKAELTHWHFDTYLINWQEEQAWFSFGTVQILKDNNGKPSGLQFDVPNDDIFFEEIKASRLDP